MKNLVIGIVIVLGLIGTTLAQDKLEATAQVDFFSKYIWRGQNFTDGPVTQPSVNLSYKRFTLSAWGNLELDNINSNRWNITETDITLDYTSYLPGQKVVEYSFGFIRYDFPNTSFDNTTEIYAGLGLKTSFNPYIKLYRDIDEADGTYVSVGISESLWHGFDVGASLGWGDRSYNNFYWGKNSDRLNDLVLSISRPIETKWFDIVPSLTYVSLLDKDLGRIGKSGRDDFVFGISFRKEF